MAVRRTQTTKMMPSLSKTSQRTIWRVSNRLTPVGITLMPGSSETDSDVGLVKDERSEPDSSKTVHATSDVGHDETGDSFATGSVSVVGPERSRGVLTQMCRF